MKSGRLLIIDDDRAVRASFQLALEDTVELVDLAESGEQGLEKQAASDYDLIFLDLKMPGLNGVETLRKIRERNRDVPVYIVTAFHPEFLTELEQARRDSLDFELMKKPLGEEGLTSVVESVLA